MSSVSSLVVFKRSLFQNEVKSTKCPYQTLDKQDINLKMYSSKIRLLVMLSLHCLKFLFQQRIMFFLYLSHRMMKNLGVISH